MEVLEDLKEIAPDVEDKWAPQQDPRNATQGWRESINRSKDPPLCLTAVEFSTLLKSLASGDGNIKGGERSSWPGDPTVIGPWREDPQARPTAVKILQDLELTTSSLCI